MDDGIERQIPHPDLRNRDTKSKAMREECCFWCIFMSVGAVFMMCIVVPIQYFTADVHYSIDIDSVSSHDPTTMGLSFNLTLGVASRSYGAKACVDPGMYVEVFYHGTQLAASKVETGRLCAGPRKAVETPVVARATGVPLGQVLDDLVTDMRQDVAAFHVILHVPAGSYGGTASQRPVRWVLECKGRRLGEAATPCDSPEQEAMLG